MDNSSSQFFKLKNNLNTNIYSMSEFKGWNGLVLINLCLSKNTSIKNDSIYSENFNISEKEKIFVLVKGKAEFLLDNKCHTMEAFDAINLFSKNLKYEIKCKEDSQFFLISAENLTPIKKNAYFFNFKKDIVPNDIWGGQCISRVFFGDSLNLVLFDLKSGFKFHDEGHKNEQLTWVIEGDMDFYVNKLKNKLSPGLGVDIGSFDVHGGISNGAVGFDAFYPKRKEKIYK